MKIITIKCEHTRQVYKFQPVKFELTAQLEEGDDPVRMASELQEIVLRVIYKDNPKLRDLVISQLLNEESSEMDHTKSDPKPGVNGIKKENSRTDGFLPTPTELNNNMEDEDPIFKI